MPIIPSDLLFEASLEGGDDEARILEAAGWQRRSETEFALELAAWRDAREPLAAAMAAAVASWLPYFATFDLTSQAAAEAVHDEPLLREGRERFDAWLGEPQPEWLTPAPA